MSATQTTAAGRTDRAQVFATLAERVRGDVALARRHAEGFLLPHLFPNVVAIVMHRLAHAANELGCPILARMLSVLGQLLTGADIDYAANLGPGVYLVHPVGVVIGPETVSGRNLVLLGGVTLGGIWNPRSRPRAGYPVLGNDIEVCTNASVIGPVSVGDGVVIGAHALVLHDVPAGAVSRGVPAASYIDGAIVGPGGATLAVAKPGTDDHSGSPELK